MPGTHLIKTCSIWRALEVVGDTPTLLILEASWLRARRFDDFLRMTGLLKALLSDRLKRLVAARLFEKKQYSDAPVRFHYVLTRKGQDLYWTALMLLRWELTWGAGAGKIQLSLTHRCGKKFLPVLACSHCRESVDASQVDWKEGPGVGWMEPHYSRRRRQRESSESGTTLFERSAQLMGDRWAGLILRSVFTGIRRYDEIQQDTAMATNILAERLAWLTEIGLIRAVRYARGPDRYEYRITRKAFDYYPALLLLLQWGDKYYASPEGPPLLLTHRSCKRELKSIVVCSACREPLAAADVTFSMNRPAVPSKKRVRQNA